MDNKFKGQRRKLLCNKFCFRKTRIVSSNSLPGPAKTELFCVIKRRKTFQQEKKRASCERNCFCHTFQGPEWNSLENRVKTFIKCFFSFWGLRWSKVQWSLLPHKDFNLKQDPFSHNRRPFSSSPRWKCGFEKGQTKVIWSLKLTV